MSSDLSKLSAEEKRRLLKNLLENKKPQNAAAEGASMANSAAVKAFHSQIDELKKFGELPFFQIPDRGHGAHLQFDDEEVINFSGYDYLGLVGHKDINDAVSRAVAEFGSTTSSSRLLCGERKIHGELEKEIASLIGVEAAMAFVGGYQTNETVMGNIVGPEDIILYDSYIHASIQEGSRLSGAKVRPFPHNDWEALNNILAQERAKYRNALIAIEGVYSMDGDIPDLPRYLEVKESHNAWILVDEAHSIGVLGQSGGGIGELFDVDRRKVDLWMGTLSKSFASCGGYLAGDKGLIEFLKYSLPGFSFSVAMTPANAAAALTALKLLRAEPSRPSVACLRAAQFKEALLPRLHTGKAAGSAIIPVFTGDTEKSMMVYHALRKEKILAMPIIFPAVAKGTERIRFFFSYAHSEQDVKRAAEIVNKVMA